MSRYLEMCQGGSNEFEIKDIEGYVKWKESLEDDEDGCAFLLHDSYSKDKKALTVHIGTPGIDMKGDYIKDISKLDTSLNHFNPTSDNNVLQFWCGLSMFTKEPIELLQTDEEWPYLTKVFGFENEDDTGMYRLWAFEGKVIVQTLDFKIVKTETHKASDLLDEEVLSAIRNPIKLFCDKCKTELNTLKFDFKTRGYYAEVKAKTGHNNMCQRCYENFKRPFVEIKKLEDEIKSKQKAIDELIRTK